jgi:hypothetical protein
MSEREPLNNKKDLLQKLLDQHERLLGEEANSPDSIREHLGRLDKLLDTVKNPQERRWILSHGRFWSNQLKDLTGEQIFIGPPKPPKGK